MNSIPDQSSSPYGNATPRSPFSPLSAEERQKTLAESKFQRVLNNHVAPEPSATSLRHGRHKFHEVFQMNQGRYSDLTAAKISEMMKANGLDNAPTQSLLSVVNGILDESMEKKNGEIPQRVACLLRKVVQEIERRISTQAEHIRTQNNVFKAREEKYQSRIKVLEALASRTGEETQTEESKSDEKRKNGEDDQVKLMKEKDQNSLEIAALRQELETTKKAYQQQCFQIERAKKVAKTSLEERLKELEQERKVANEDKIGLEERVRELEQRGKQTNAAKTGLEERVKELEQMEKGVQLAKACLEERVRELEGNLVLWKNEVKEMEANSESKHQSWSQKELCYRSFMDFQSRALQELRLLSVSIKQEMLNAQKDYSEEFNRLGKKLLALGDAAENYHAVLSENRKLFNELQDLKGNIRVYCRIRPFLPGQVGKETVVQNIGENGELVVANPSKTGKDGLRRFKFNKVFGPASTQAEVFSDTQPFIRSVLDGFNVCIFAYGQTGSGKTYTMTGPRGATESEWGVNYRALNDLFSISQSRKSSIMYEVGVQMVEIYNERVRDLLSGDTSQKRLGIVSATQQDGLAVPDASMHTVASTSDVLELMDIGLSNRAVGATALNERSSRSHSIVTVHVRGKDSKTGSVLHGSLHLVDLAGSERVDRSEVTGDRLREAQHINKSLSALGDVIFALALKSSHVPYRNCKLTQLLQSSLGGQAKTLMFVQLNPEVTSYTESMSTLKFAERVSGVELGAAKSSKEGRDVRDLMEQVASLKDTITVKDEEIERLHLLKHIKESYPHRLQKTTLGGNSFREADDNFSEADDLRHQNELVGQSKLNVMDSESLGSAEGDYEERLSDVSDSVASVGTEGSVDFARYADGKKPLQGSDRTKSRTKTTTRPREKLRQVATRTSTLTKATGSMSPTLRKTGSSSSLHKSTKRWQ